MMDIQNGSEKDRMIKESYKLYQPVFEKLKQMFRMTNLNPIINNAFEDQIKGIDVTIKEEPFNGLTIDLKGRSSKPTLRYILEKNLIPVERMSHITQQKDIDIHATLNSLKNDLMCFAFHEMNNYNKIYRLYLFNTVIYKQIAIDGDNQHKFERYPEDFMDESTNRSHLFNLGSLLRIPVKDFEPAFFRPDLFDYFKQERKKVSYW